MEKFGVILRKLRKEKHMSQKELANKLFKAESTIRMWELGINQPDNDTLVDLSHMFDVSTDYLLGVSDIRNNTDLKDNLNKIKESGQYEVNTDLTDEELEANLEELLSGTEITYQGKVLNKEEIKDILNYAKFKLSQRDENK